MNSEYVSLTEASAISGYDIQSIIRWCRGNHVRYSHNGSEHQKRWKPSLSSLFAHIHEVNTAEKVPPRTYIKPRYLDRDIDKAMNEVQLAAHDFLMSQPDVIECQRGARLTFWDCQAYVERHYGLSRCVGCIGCGRYVKPNTMPKEDPTQGFQTVRPLQKDARADMREYEHQRPGLFMAAETRAAKPKPQPKEKRGDAAKRISRERMEASKEKLQKDALVRRAKKLKARGKSFREVGTILGISKTTAERYVTGKDWR